MSPHDPLLVTLPGIGTLPLPRWAAPFAGLLALAGIAAIVWSLWAPHLGHLVSGHEADATLRADIAEYTRHLAEDPERIVALIEDGPTRGTLRVRMFPDGCVVLVRQWGGQAWTRFVRALDREDPARTGERLPTPAAMPSWPSRAPGVQRVSAAGSTAPCQGRCIQHQDQPTTTYGERRGCLVPVFWAWRDGCRAWAWYDTCRQAWETDREGRSIIRWTCCVH